MQAIQLANPDGLTPTPVKRLPEQSLLLVNYLRMVARRSRSAARMDLNEACGLLLADPANADMRHAEILIRGFKQAVGKRPVFFQPDTDDISFDEAWLGRLFETLALGDEDSFVFLIKSRVPLWTQRNFAFLIRSISEQFSQT